MSDNGHTSKIIVDLNRVTRTEFRQFRKDLAGIEDGDMDAREIVVSAFYAKVVASWPFEAELTPESYLALGLLDASKVDQAVNEAVTAISEKN